MFVFFKQMVLVFAMVVLTQLGLHAQSKDKEPARPQPSVQPHHPQPQPHSQPVAGQKNHEEAARLAEAARKAHEEAVRKAQAARKEHEEAIRKAEGARKAHEDAVARKAHNEALRKAHDEAMRKAAATRKAHDEAVMRMEAARKEHEEAARKAAAARKAHDESLKKAETAKNAHEEEIKRAAAKKLDIARKAREEEIRKVEAAKKVHEEELRKVEAARKAHEEETKKAAAEKAHEEESRKAEAARRAREEELRKAEAARKAHKAEIKKTETATAEKEKWWAERRKRARAEAMRLVLARKHKKAGLGLADDDSSSDVSITQNTDGSTSYQDNEFPSITGTIPPQPAVTTPPAPPQGLQEIRIPDAPSPGPNVSGGNAPTSPIRPNKPAGPPQPTPQEIAQQKEFVKQKHNADIYEHFKHSNLKGMSSAELKQKIKNYDPDLQKAIMEEWQIQNKAGGATIDGQLHAASSGAQGKINSGRDNPPAASTPNGKGPAILPPGFLAGSKPSSASGATSSITSKGNSGQVTSPSGANQGTGQSTHFDFGKTPGTITAPAGAGSAKTDGGLHAASSAAASAGQGKSNGGTPPATGNGQTTSPAAGKPSSSGNGSSTITDKGSSGQVAGPSGTDQGTAPGTHFDFGKTPGTVTAPSGSSGSKHSPLDNPIVKGVLDAAKDKAKDAIKEGLEKFVPGGGLAFSATEFLNDLVLAYEKELGKNTLKNNKGAKLVYEDSGLGGTTTGAYMDTMEQGYTTWQDANGQWFVYPSAHYVPKTGYVQLLRPTSKQSDGTWGIKAVAGTQKVDDAGRAKAANQAAKKVIVDTTLEKLKDLGKDKIGEQADKLIPGSKNAFKVHDAFIKAVEHHQEEMAKKGLDRNRGAKLVGGRHGIADTTATAQELARKGRTVWRDENGIWYSVRDPHYRPHTPYAEIYRPVQKGADGAWEWHHQEAP